VKSVSKKNIQTGMILAAGLGSRLKPWTDHHPKALAIVNGKSLLQRNIEYLQQYDIHNIVVNVHHFADQIVNAIKENNGWGSVVVISDETDMVLETGGGLLKAKELLAQQENFVLMNCDILTNLDLQKMIDYHVHANALATLAIVQRTTSRYLLFNEEHEMVGWHNVTTNEEKLPAHKKLIAHEVPAPYAFSGIHIVHRSIFDHIHFTGKFSMIDLYLDICNTQKIIGYNHTNDLVLDVGKPEAIEKAEQLFPQTFYSEKNTF
jgi:N-acetyl-alpha-D-muramate 1-phosphate uridylyltransferase